MAIQLQRSISDLLTQSEVVYFFLLPCMETQFTTAIDQLHHALEQLRDGSLQTRDFCHQARTQEVLLGALPERYQTVWLGQIDSLSIWLDKAQRLLEA